MAVDSPATETYQEIEKMIYNLCWKYAGRGLEFEECVGVANLAFAEAYPKFDSRKGSSFSTWIYNCVSHALLDFSASEQKYRQRNAMVDQTEYDVEDTRTHRLSNVLAELSEDARIVAQTIIESPQELAGVLRCRKPENMRRGVWQYFRQLGWSIGHTADCFEEIREALG